MSLKRSQIDYESVIIPKDKDRKKFTYIERRSEILLMVIERGSPDAINRTELAKLYGKSCMMITKDMDALGEYISARIGKRAKFKTEIAFNKIINAAIRNTDPKSVSNAIRALKEWNNWMFDLGVQERVAQKVELSGSIESQIKSLDIIYDEVKNEENNGSGNNQSKEDAISKGQER